MAVISGHHPITKEICDAFGLKNVTSLKLIMDINDIIRVETIFYAEDKDLEKLVPIFKKYKVVVTE